MKKTINGYQIYKSSTWCEVTKNSQEIYIGSCDEDITCEEIYNQVTAKVEFYFKNKLLISYDKINESYGERKSTIELLAHENKCSENEIKVIIKKENYHVYCTNCQSWRELLKSIMCDFEVPKQCEDCYPYNPEDSFELSIRKNYKKQDL